MPDFPLALALYDVILLVLTAVALWCLVHYIDERLPAALGMAALGALLVLLAEALQLAWTLLLVSRPIDLPWPWLAELPLGLVAPGFTLLTIALFGVIQGEHFSQRGRWMLALGVILVAAVAAALREWGLGIMHGWFAPLFMLASLGSLGLNLLLMAAAVRLRHWLVLMVFALNLAMILALQSVVRASVLNPDHTLAEHSLALLGSACFALGVWSLREAATAAEVRARRARLRQRAEH